jgi:hypothetical protein
MTFSFPRWITIFSLVAFSGVTVLAQSELPENALTASSDERFIGQWSLTLPTQEAGWMDVQQGDEGLEVQILWGVGSARPMKLVTIENDQLRFELKARGTGKDGKRQAREMISAKVAGDRMLLHWERGDVADEVTRLEFTGRRQPPMPKAPDLGNVRFGEPITLLNGVDLSGWKVSRDDKKNGWSVRDGVLCNDTPKTDFSAYGEYANLRTVQEFDDFELHIEYRLPAEQGGNSGIYLRGLYEVQVTHRDSRMQGINGPGAVFGRVTPTKNAGKAAGEWESYDLTLVDRHVSVVLNGQRVIDNQPVEGCTGGALISDVTRPGPIYLQGDHTSVQYRNIVLRPVLR